MSKPADLNEIIERNVKALELRPSIGQGTATTNVRVRSNLTCDIADGKWRLVADDDAGSGGDDLGPDPGVLVRAGLGSCLAIGYMMWAARLGVVFESVDVQVDADYDARGMYGIEDGVSPGWTAVRYITTIASAAPPERVREVVDVADSHSPVLDDLRRGLAVSGDLRIAPSGADAERPAPVTPPAE